MEQPPPDDLAQTLGRARAGDEAAAAALLPVVYAQLRRLAGSYLRDSGHTLQPTALVHEAFLRLIQSPGDVRDRGHFIAVAATAMRHILIDAARRRGADKRGGKEVRVTLDGAAFAGALARAGAAQPVDLLDLEAALVRLAEASPRQARIVELQFFGGLTADETAEVLGVSTSLVEKEWRRARAWLRTQLAASE